MGLQAPSLHARDIAGRSPLSSVKAPPEEKLSWKTWKTAHFEAGEAGQGVLDDPDDDGLPNLCEYAFGDDPQRPFHRIGLESPGSFEPWRIGGRAGIRLQLPESLPSDLVYEVQQSPTLQDARWTTLARKQGSTAWRSEVGVRLEQESLASGRIRMLLQPETATQASGYFRLRLSLTNPLSGSMVENPDELTQAAVLARRERSWPQGAPLFVRPGVAHADWSSGVDFEVTHSGRLTSSSALEESVVWIPGGTTLEVVDAVKVKVLAVDGTLQLRPGARLEVGTILVEDGGHLDVRGEDIEIVFNGSLAGDPSQSGVGIQAMGKVSIDGSQRRRAFGMVDGALAGSAALTVDPAFGWRVGDQLAFPDLQDWAGSTEELDESPDLYRGRLEIRTVVALTEQGLQLDRPLEYDHLLEDGCPVAHLTRSIKLRSSAASPVRAHALFAGETDIIDAEFIDMGRTTAEEIDRFTNPDGRFPCHLQNATRFELTHVSVHASSQTIPGSPRHGIVQRGGLGTIRDCVVVGAQSSGIQLADETGVGEWVGNVVFPAGSQTHYQRDSDRFVSHTGRELGRAPYGFWLRGSGVTLRDARVYGFGLSAYATFLQRASGRGGSSRYLLRSFDECEAQGTFLDGPVTVAYAPSADSLIALDVEDDLLPRRRSVRRATDATNGIVAREDVVASYSPIAQAGGPWRKASIRVPRPNEGVSFLEAAEGGDSSLESGVELVRVDERSRHGATSFELERSGDLDEATQWIEGADLTIPSGREAVIRSEIALGRLTIGGRLRIAEGGRLRASAVVIDVGGKLTVEGQGADALLGRLMDGDSSPYEGLAGVVAGETLCLLDSEPFEVTQAVWDLLFRDIEKSGIRTLRHGAAGRRTDRGAVIDRKSLSRPTTP